MPKKSLLEDVEFMEIVRICITTKRTYTEAVRILQKAGFQIKSAKTFQRAKEEIMRTRKKRIEQIAKDFPDHADDTVDTAIAVDHELWNIVKTAKDHWQQMKAIEMIMKNCRDKTEYLESSPVLAELSKKLKDKKTDSEKTTTVEIETTKSTEVNPDNVGQDQESRTK
jgi:beta-lactam-binding protein with PASTA domain